MLCSRHCFCAYFAIITWFTCFRAHLMIITWLPLLCLAGEGQESADGQAQGEEGTGAAESKGAQS
jgi:hypothetical protein